MLQLILTNFAIMFGLFVLVWLISIRIKDASIVDILWGPACAMPAVLTWLLADGTDPRATLITVLAVIWSARLGLYLARRNLGHGEDFRYVNMRKKAGSDQAFVWWSFWRVFMLQLGLSFFVSLPIQVGQIGGPASLGLLAWAGIVIFTIGLAFETIGDIQLRNFKKDPANKGILMDKGLWAWTRHPNYFGDATVWTGLFLIALESPYGIYTVLSLALMIHLLMNISGKALLEMLMAKRYENYDDYKSRVSGFFPLPPKKSSPPA